MRVARPLLIYSQSPLITSLTRPSRHPVRRPPQHMAYSTPFLPLLKTVFEVSPELRVGNTRMMLITWPKSILEVFILCVAGYILARRGVLDRPTQKVSSFFNQLRQSLPATWSCGKDQRGRSTNSSEWLDIYGAISCAGVRFLIAEDFPHRAYSAVGLNLPWTETVVVEPTTSTLRVQGWGALSARIALTHAISTSTSSRNS